VDREHFKAKLKAGEVFHRTQLPAAHWCVVRVDGRGFSRLTESHFQKPFDDRFHTLMLGVASLLLAELRGVAAYTQSDEASVLLPPDWSMFDRSYEKTVSVSAGMASSAFSAAWGKPAHFDARVWIAANPGDVADYMRWRQSDCHRCALSGACYWALRRSGIPGSQAGSSLEREHADSQRALLRQHGVDFDRLPAWQRHGTALTWEAIEKPGFNPVQGVATTARRQRMRTDECVPDGQAFGEYFLELMQEHGSRATVRVPDGEKRNA
jgi:tRNA(His) guanylyltransferase